MSPRSRELNEKIREQSKEKIIQSALELFAVKGYQSVTVSEIAKKAKVAKGLIYNYFKSKEDILMEITQNISMEMIAFMEEMENEKDPTKRIELLVESTFQILVNRRQFYELIMPLLSQPSFTKEMKQSLSTFIKILVQDLEISLERMNVPNPKVESLTVGALIDGIAWHYLFVYHEKYPIVEMKNQILSYLHKITK